MSRFSWRGEEAMEQLDCVVVGAGVVGLAVARALALAGREVMVLEARGRHRHRHQLAQQRGHPRRHLLPARFAEGAAVRRRASELLYAYCAERGVAHRRCGKLIVATAPAQLRQLAASAAQARGQRRRTTCSR